MLSFFIVTFPSLNKVLWEDLISMHSFSLFIQYHTDRGSWRWHFRPHIEKGKVKFSLPCLFILQMKRCLGSRVINKLEKFANWRRYTHFLPYVCSTFTWALCLSHYYGYIPLLLWLEIFNSPIPYMDVYSKCIDNYTIWSILSVS